MGKIPRGLSDKDMLQGYVEQVTMESQFLAAEEAEDKRRRARAGAAAAPEKNIALTGFTEELTEELGRRLLELKMELFREGVRSYTMKVKREGRSIIITPVEPKPGKGSQEKQLKQGKGVSSRRR